MQGSVTYLNPIAEAMTGWTDPEARGLPLSVVFNIVNANTREIAPNPLEVAINENKIVGLAADSVLIRRDGLEVSIEDSAAPIHDRAGNVLGGVLVFHDVSEARALAFKMAHLAQHDSLTDLPNRELINDRLVQAITLAKRRGGRLALLFIDLDRFKQINDTFGHSTGDKLLKEVARQLSGCVRASDTVGRLGGDEFIVLLPEIDEPQSVAHVADKLLSAVSVSYRIEGHELPISLSVGISIYPEDGHDAETIIKNADAAMYEAKAHGRNNYQFFAPSMTDRARQRFKLEVELRQALTKGELP